jgi:hypothetical protein
MKRSLLILVAVLFVSVSTVEAASMYSPKRERAYRARVAQFVAARAKQSAKPAVGVAPAPLAKMN